MKIENALFRICSGDGGRQTERIDNGKKFNSFLSDHNTSKWLPKCQFWVEENSHNRDSLISKMNIFLLQKYKLSWMPKRKEPKQQQQQQ